MTRRKPLPKGLERKIITKNRYCCCVCQKDGLGKEILIHHIDGNNSNNVLSNLAILCLTHASIADAALSKGKLGSGKKLKPNTIKEFKNIWERKIEEEAKIKKTPIPSYKKKQLEILYQFEINKTKNEILSFKDSDKRIKEKFSFFDQLVLEELICNLSLRKILIKAYSDIAIQSIDSPQLIKRLTKSLWGLFLHLVGPEYVKIYKEDIVLFNKSIDTLITLGQWAGEFTEDRAALKQVCSMIHDFCEIAHWYKLKAEKRKLIKSFKKISTAIDEYEKEVKNKTPDNERKKRKQIVKETINKIQKIK